MPIFFHVSYEGAADIAFKAGAGRRLRVAAMQYANYQVARYWHRFMLPGHFKRNAKRRYKHKRRRQRYSQIKQDMAHGIGLQTDPRTGQVTIDRVLKGGVVDIVRSGQSESRARKTRNFSSTATGWTVKMRVPKYLVQRRKGSFPDMKREIGTNTGEEARLLARIWWAAYRKFLNRNRVRQTSVIK